MRTPDQHTVDEKTVESIRREVIDALRLGRVSADIALVEDLVQVALMAYDAGHDSGMEAEREAQLNCEEGG